VGQRVEPGIGPALELGQIRPGLPRWIEGEAVIAHTALARDREAGIDPALMDQKLGLLLRSRELSEELLHERGVSEPSRFAFDHE
jgi:hypothetical protein